MVRTARCCCGACEVEVEGEPTLNAVCRCNSCKKRTGSAIGWSAYFPDERIVARRGDLKPYNEASRCAWLRLPESWPIHA